MAISERTRKIIWIEAGGRCSICRRHLLNHGSSSADPSVFGEEAHIVGRGANGPRAGGLDAKLIDGHDNLILLCSEHHKQIDDQVADFPVARLRKIKEDHKKWIASLDSSESKPIKLIRDPRHSIPELLKLISRGSEIWTMIEEGHAFEYALPDHMEESDEDLAIEFLDLVGDYMDISADLGGIRQKRDAQKLLQEYIENLRGRGLLVGAALYRMLLVGGAFDDPWPWVSLRVEVQGVDHAKVVDKSSNDITGFPADGQSKK
ncbi:HNH endonuclease [Nocardiopsis terrae]